MKKGAFESKSCGPLVIVGTGLSGRAAARVLENLGWKPAQDFVFFDEKTTNAEFPDTATLIKKFKPKTLLVSPGVPLKKPWIQEFLSQGGNLTSEIALAYEFLNHEKIVAVTGSLGKSTTAALLGAGLAAAKISFFLGGNFGFPLADYVCDLREKKREAADWLVLELSSFQIENLGNFQCEAAVFTYLCENHLERYSGLEDYYGTKWRLARSSRHGIVLNENGGDLLAFVRGQNADAPLHWTSALKSKDKEHFATARLLGAHNQDNLAMTFAVADLLGWPSETKAGMLAFGGLAHRLQNIGTLGGIDFINDSKATAIESVQTAVQSLLSAPQKYSKIFLLLGGRDKKLPWVKLRSLQKEARLNFIFFGECGSHAQKASGLVGPHSPTLGEALKNLLPLVKSGDAVLLSPGGSSLDEFKNFEDRGNSFAQMARSLFNR